jgi:TolB-like protein/Tfp pilus assembly protein PilF
MGEYEVKHGLRLHLVNLCKNGIGNPATPEKLRRGHRWKTSRPAVSPVRPTPRWPRSLLAIALGLSIIALAISSSILLRHGVSPPPPKSPVSAPAKTIAVLPFENFGTDPQSEVFADGVQDEVLTDLAKIADLKVISRTSVMQYKHSSRRNLRDIATALGVANVLEGSVQRTGNRVKVNAQLIDANTDTHLWADSYERDIADVFAIQSEIAKAIADQLRAKISPTEKAAIEKPPTADLVAFDLYQRAKALWPEFSDAVRAREKLPEAEQLLTEAVQRDAQFLLGWCLLSRVHGAFYWYAFDRTQRRLQQAENAVQTALRLQPDSGEAHLAAAVYHYFGHLDYERALNELNTAQKSLPNNAEIYEYTGYIQRRQGDWQASTRNLSRALELDPRNIFTLGQLANSYQSQHRYADQMQTFDLILSIRPNEPSALISRAVVFLHWKADIGPFQQTLATITAKNSEIVSAVDDPNYALCERTPAAAERVLAHYPRGGITTNYGVNSPYSFWQGVIARIRGEKANADNAFQEARTEMLKVLDAEPDYPAALSLLGIIDAALGHKQEAIREGERACQLVPVTRDAVTAAALAVNLAQIYAWTGEKDLAIERIATLEATPNELSYGLLKLSPTWDSLRGDPRFERIINSLAPH